MKSRQGKWAEMADNLGFRVVVFLGVPGGHLFEVLMRGESYYFFFWGGGGGGGGNVPLFERGP